MELKSKVVRIECIDFPSVVNHLAPFTIMLFDCLVLMFLDVLSLEIEL